MPVSNSATLHHTCILVNDLEKSAEKLAKTLSVTWNLWTIAPDHCFVNGDPSHFSFRVGFAQVGGANLELISPHSGHSVYDDHLKSKGEAITTLVLLIQIWKVCNLPKMNYKNKDIKWFKTVTQKAFLNSATLS